MVTLLIGMLLAFILGAMTVILTLRLNDTHKVQTTQPATNPGTSKPTVMPDTMKSVEDKKKEDKTEYELAEEKYNAQMKNMLAYDGSEQEGARVNGK